MLECCGDTANASACFSINSKSYGFTSVPFQFSKNAMTTIWEAVNLPGLSGTIVVIGNCIAGTMRIAINGSHTTQLNNHDTFAVSSNPLNSVTITYSTSSDSLTSIKVSLSAARFEY